MASSPLVRWGEGTGWFEPDAFRGSVVVDETINRDGWVCNCPGTDNSTHRMEVSYCAACGLTRHKAVEATRILPKYALVIAKLEKHFKAKVVLSDDGKPGGWCNCCSSEVVEKPSYQNFPWLIYRYGKCDADGVYYATLCQGCLEEQRKAFAAREKTPRDEQAEVITHLMGSDLDGAKTTMDDFPGASG